MTNQHPIKPPASLLDGWYRQHYGSNKGFNEILIEVAQWGADQELNACCEWLMYEQDRQGLRDARRPRGASLKERITAEIENGTACDRESSRIASDVILEISAWACHLGYRSCSAELKRENDK